MISQRKPKINNIIFSRACCCIGIVVFHYFCHSKGKFKFLYSTANSDFGFMFVTSFFCISGFVLYYNYPLTLTIKKFYYKRWKSILVPYYITFIYFFFIESFLLKKVIFFGNWKMFLFNIIGLDGFFSYRFKTNYLVGEWFLGAIIIIYLLFPIILFLTNKISIFINIIFLCIIYFLMYKGKNFFIISQQRNIITCIASLFFGMEAFKFKHYILDNNLSIIISSFLLILLCSIKIDINFKLLIFQLQGFCLFIFLYKIGYYAMQTKIHFIFEEISNLSYNIFLFHHKLIIYIFSIHKPEKWYANILLLLLSIIIIIICSKIHLMVVNRISKSYIFKKLDKLFIS